jgi:hypothetical protein
MVERNRKIYRFISICLQLADLADEKKETPYTDCIGTGYAAFSGYMRKGVQEIIDLMSNYYIASENCDYMAASDKQARDFLEECFGDRTIDDINEDDKKRIIELCQKIKREWEEAEK